jgi:hypothetical protein
MGLAGWRTSGRGPLRSGAIILGGYRNFVQTEAARLAPPRMGFDLTGGLATRPLLAAGKLTCSEIGDHDLGEPLQKRDPVLSDRRLAEARGRSYHG